MPWVIALMSLGRASARELIGQPLRVGPWEWYERTDNAGTDRWSLLRRPRDPRRRGSGSDGRGLPRALSRSRRRAEADRAGAQRGPRVPDPLPARVRGRGLDPAPERGPRLRRRRQGRAAVRDDAVRR